MKVKCRRVSRTDGRPDRVGPRWAWLRVCQGPPGPLWVRPWLWTAYHCLGCVNKGAE
jgi:hypothetical protein